MKIPQPDPAIMRLLSQPCRLCGGTEFSYLPQVCFEQVAGSSTHHFEVVVCRACRVTELFIKRLDELERLNSHATVRVPSGGQTV